MLKETLKERLLKYSQIEENEYLEAYCELILKNYGRKKESKKTQSHHIIPRALFKMNNEKVDDSRSNRINLYYKDHILAHYYLCLCSKDSLFRYYMFMCLKFMCKEFQSGENIYDFVESLDAYQKLYEESMLKHAELTRARFKGKSLPLEMKMKISETNKKVHSQMVPMYIPEDDNSYTFVNISEVDTYFSLGYIRGRPKNISIKMGEGQRGKIIRDEQREKFSFAKKGKIRVFKEDITKLISKDDLDNYLEQGWTRGMSERNRKSISVGSILTACWRIRGRIMTII